MDKEVLLKRKAGLRTTEVPLDDGEIVVMVRGLSSGEVREIKKEHPNEAEAENAFIAKALVDPVMTYEEVTLWLSGDPNDPDDHGAPAGDGVAVMQAVADLSGISEGARKSRVPGNRGKRRR